MNSPSFGKAFVYILPCNGEDILKLGFSRDPLIRLQTLHHRYFDFFDIDRAFMIETDRVRDARSLERELGSQIAQHRAPAPLMIRPHAGGHTEWYRGALQIVLDRAESLKVHRGHMLWPLRPWLRARLQQQSDNFVEWSTSVCAELDIARAQGLGAIAHRLELLLRDTLDAFAAFDIARPPSDAS
ncbi:MAG: GIY-YIG nuclease family protein [Rudaea sp.]